MHPRVEDHGATACRFHPRWNGSCLGATGAWTKPLVTPGDGMRSLKILLADDHAMVRKGLRKLLEERPGWQVLEAGDGREAVRIAEEAHPDIAVLDIAMPVLNGIEAARQIADRLPGTRVAILSMHADEIYVAQALRAGATGYLLKESADTELLAGVAAVADGRPFFSPAVEQLVDAAAWPGQEVRRDRYDSLSAREREIFQLVAEGRTNKAIASLLAISPSTVETHRARIMDKLDMHSAVEIVRYAVRRGVIR